MNGPKVFSCLLFQQWRSKLSTVCQKILKRQECEILFDSARISCTGGQLAGNFCWYDTKGSSETIRWISNSKAMKINKDWLTGFVDGEGCFYVGINKSSDLKIGYQVLPEFRIIQHEKDVELLYSIKKFLGYGSVVKNRSHNSKIMEYRIRSIDSLIKVIIPFFEKNKLLTRKNLDFISFRKVILIMKNGDHLNSEGLEQIWRIKNRMNRNKEKIESQEEFQDSL